jgi:hypothetical protein
VDEGVLMTEPVNEIEALRAERGELRERLFRITGTLGGAVSQILWYYWVSSVPEDLARTIDDRIAPVRWATGWEPYVDRTRGYEPDGTAEERRARRGLPLGPHPHEELLFRTNLDLFDLETLRSERDELQEALEYHIGLRQVAISNMFVLYEAAPERVRRHQHDRMARVMRSFGRPPYDDGHRNVDKAEVTDVLLGNLAPPIAVVTSDGIPRWLDGWFTNTEYERYCGMATQEAVEEAERDGIVDVRLIAIPFEPPFHFDYKPGRLNLAISEERVIRADCF